MANEHLRNDNINAVRPLDLVQDEYGNYYVVVGDTNKSEKLTKVTISHIYFEKSFYRILLDEVYEKYKGKHIGIFLQDLVTNDIEQLKKQGRTIFSIKDLIENGTEVEFLDQTIPHPRSNVNK